ncbi:MAG: hypothetical protein LBK64_05595 [Spirochaetaceae bacterium]|nr:hypothetical protein [Spirochaetaceae bacterium]
MGQAKKEFSKAMKEGEQEDKKEAAPAEEKKA